METDQVWWVGWKVSRFDGEEWAALQKDLVALLGGTFQGSIFLHPVSPGKSRDKWKIWGLERLRDLYVDWGRGLGGGKKKKNIMDI